MTTSIAQLVKDIVLETLWPERCACCEEAGGLLCEGCELNLPYIDACNACPVCGSAYGRVQCCDCSATLLSPLGLERPPYDECVSAVILDAHSKRMVTLYKDAGDRHLANILARILAQATPQHWLGEDAAVSFLPASAKAVRRRGWDHAERLARTYAQTLGLPLVRLFARPVALDQRALTRRERFVNMEHAVQLLPGTTPSQCVILVDDVYTTGSTLFAAATRIKHARPGARVFCITFART